MAWVNEEAIATGILRERLTELSREDLELLTAALWLKNGMAATNLIGAMLLSTPVPLELFGITDEDGEKMMEIFRSVKLDCRERLDKARANLRRIN